MWCIMLIGRVLYFPFFVSMLVLPFYHLSLIFSSCACVYFPFSFITCGFGGGVPRTLAIPPLHSASLLPRAGQHFIPLLIMALVQG